MMACIDDRFVRQAELIPRDRVDGLLVTVVGIGSVGRPLALMLAACGVRHLQLIDPDVVELHNVTSQGFSVQDVGRSKVDVLTNQIQNYDSSVRVTGIKGIFRKHEATGGVIFCCVDSISSRSVIWKAVAARTCFWADARMLGENLRILAAADDTSRKHYPTTLFEQSEAHVGRCTGAKSTLYAASLAAALLMHQFSRYLRGIAVDRDVMVNLLAGEMVAC